MHTDSCWMGGMGVGAEGRVFTLQALGALVGVVPAPGRGCSLPAGAALRQTLQNGLQVLLVSADLGKVTLEALDLQLLLLRLLLQQPQFPLQGPGRAQP